MNLNKEKWTKTDITEYYKYRESFKGNVKDCSWEQRIINTKLDCYGRTSTKAKEVVKEIKKGNYLDFLDNLEIKNHFDSMVECFLLNSIKDSDTFNKYLDKFSYTIDNWASTDTLKFSKKNKDDMVILSNRYLKSDLPFRRRIAVNVYFDLIKEDKYFDKAIILLNSLKNEDAYYVNMAAAWLLSYMFVVNRDKTIDFFKNNTTNDFVINKGISKCRDSYRVTKEDKDMLLKFKKR